MEQRIAAIETRIDRMLGTTEPDPTQEAAHLSGLELALLEALHEHGDPDRGHPVLADASAWRDLAEDAGASDAAGEADRFVARLIDEEAAEFRKQLQESDDADECFRALADARGLDLEALSRRRQAPPLERDLPAMRERFLAAIQKNPPEDAQRRAWSMELLDRADVVLTGIDDVEPDRARARIDRVVTDLDWQRANVEAKHPLRRARLKRKVSRLYAERQERELQHRLESRFGVDSVARFERLILFLIVLVLGILTVEMVSDFSQETLLVLHIIDAGACVIFLGEFFVKLSMVDRRRSWFLRHFFVDFLPSIPFAFLLRWARALRFLRFLRIARYVRLLQPLIRLVRAFGFLTRGVDRVVRKYGEILNRNIVLYPTREERAAMDRQRENIATRLRKLQARLNERWEALLTTIPRDRRDAVVSQRIDGLERALAGGFMRGSKARESLAPGARDLAADTVLHDLGSLTPQQLEAEMGQDFVSRVARAIRLFSLPPIRWFPVIRRYVPRIGRGMEDADVVVAAAHRSAKELKRHHDRYFWFADLYGTVTPAQFVDRVGTAMVNGARRPAFRLAMFGLVFLVVTMLLGQAETGTLYTIEQWLRKVIGPFLLVLGSLCIAILGVGWYLRSVAGQATDFFTQSARAQYLGLTEAIKGKSLGRDAAIFNRRVFGPERILRGEEPSADDESRFLTEVRRWLVATQPTGVHSDGFDPIDRAVWIYRDSLDGALLGINDTHTTAQLIGNPALRNMRLMAERITKSDSKALAKLDLERQKSFLRGPYLWFSLVCKSVEHGVARLLVDYNRHALPLRQIPNASDDEKRSYNAWLDAEAVEQLRSDKVVYVTNDFTALHFLDVDEARDRQVETRFGPRVLKRLQRDRKHLVRRIFGTYPLHKRPRDERVLNLYRVYNRWLAGGRALLIPFRLFWRWVRYCGRFVRWLGRCVHEIRRPRFHVDVDAAEGSDYRTALRKIQRMRGPIAEVAMRMRARLDPEYLGVRLPGSDRSGLEEFDIDQDLSFLRAAPDLARAMERERQRASRDMVRLSRLLEGGLFLRTGLSDATPEHTRAAAAAYVGDVRMVRRYLSAPEILGGVYERARLVELLPRAVWPRPRLKRAFGRWWKQYGTADRVARRAAWRATVHNVDGARDALVVWRKEGDNARAEGERILSDLLRHPERITEQLVTMRTVQTLSLIDMLNYREHIYRLGDYASSGDDANQALDLA